MGLIKKMWYFDILYFGFFSKSITKYLKRFAKPLPKMKFLNNRKHKKRREDEVPSTSLIIRQDYAICRIMTLTNTPIYQKKKNQSLSLISLQINK